MEYRWNTGTGTVWDSLKSSKNRWLFQLTVLSQQRLNDECPRISTDIPLRYKDYADGSRTKTMHLDGEEFVRRYLLHVLPKGFTRIRHYGFLAGCCRTKRLAQIHEALAASKDSETPDPPCPICRIGTLRLIGELLPGRVITQTKRR
jgi:hypothetical protein